MRVILWGINYAPESIGIAPFNQELCAYLAERGHDVEVVTTFPYYPQWKKRPADCGCWHRTEMMAGVHVHRCWCYVPAVVTPLRRIFHELSFGLSSLQRLMLRPRADVYVVVSPPLVLGLLAWIVATLKRSRFVFHVQDLQPDAAVSLGMLKPGRLVRALYALEEIAYRKAAVISGISDGMMQVFRRKGVPPAKCAHLPNWLRLDANPLVAPMDRTAARTFFGVESSTLLAFYAGNLGRKQSLEILIDAALSLMVRPAPSGAGIKLIIAGDGAARAELEQRLKAHAGLGVQLLPLLSDEHYAALLHAADLALITQASGTGAFFFPSKLLSVLAAGLPVVGVADPDSELSRAITAGGFGCLVTPGDADGLATVLRNLSGSRSQLATWATRTNWVKQFSRDSILPRFERMLLAAARGHHLTPANPAPETETTVAA